MNVYWNSIWCGINAALVSRPGTTPPTDADWRCFERRRQGLRNRVLINYGGGGHRPGLAAANEWLAG